MCLYLRPEFWRGKGCTSSTFSESKQDFAITDYCKVLLKLIYVILFVSLIGCSDYKSDYSNIEKLPRDQRVSAYEKLSPDKQIKIFLIGMRQEPPDLYYLDSLAAQGEKAIPFMLDFLDKEENDYNKYNLLRAFKHMHLHYLELSKKQEVIAAIQQSIATIKEPAYKQLSEQISQTLSKQP